MMSDTKVLTTATEKQAAYIKALLVKHDDYSLEFAGRVLDALDSHSMPRQKASEVIDWLLKKPVRVADVVISADSAVATSTAHDGTSKILVPAGHYAVENEIGTNDLDFFRVDIPTTGKYADITFVKRVVGGHPDYRVKGADARRVLERIVAAGIDAAAVRYGVEIGRCYVCNRTLTDDLSRSLGIGPHCRS